MKLTYAQPFGILSRANGGTPMLLRFPGKARRHARASQISCGFKKASIGTDLPEKSLSRFANGSDASLRPANILRRCESEHPQAPAISGTVIPLGAAQRIMGWSSDMTPSISTRNGGSQPQIFPMEIVNPVSGLIECCMGKKPAAEAPEIFLGEWLELFGIGPSKAAEIAGCKQPYISNISAGRKTNINALYLLRLSEHMNIKVNDFYRRPPSATQLAPFADLSPEARAAAIARRQRRA